jgi:hypothetical protein
MNFFAKIIRMFHAQVLEIRHRCIEHSRSDVQYVLYIITTRQPATVSSQSAPSSIIRTYPALQLLLLLALASIALLNSIISATTNRQTTINTAGMRRP